MAEEKMPHPGHENHLCFLQNSGFLKNSWEDYKKLVGDAEYICMGCGRSAKSADSLCMPEKL
jgi:hypothetical protein